MNWRRVSPERKRNRMLETYKEGEKILVPSRVGVCPDCGAAIYVDLFEWRQVFDGVNLYTPGERFGLGCVEDHLWDCNLETEEMVYNRVREWLKQTPFVVELDEKSPKEVDSRLH